MPISISPTPLVKTVIVFLFYGLIHTLFVCDHTQDLIRLLAEVING